MNQGRLQDRVAIVTGGAGTGQVAEELKALGGKAEGMVADITKRDQVDQVIERTVKEFRKVDILVNNAGIVRPALLEDVKEEDWDHVVSVNLKGTCFCTQATLPIMKKNRYDKIVNIGSRVSLGKTHRTVYAATKAGLIGVTRTWALELAPYNIVGPGPIATEMFQSVNPPESEKTKAIIRGIPLRRMGQPEDVANLISFLASDESSFITGQAIFICGGITVGLAHY